MGEKHRAKPLDGQDLHDLKEGVKDSMGQEPRSKMRHIVVMIVAIVGLFGSPVRADPITGIVSFGDSLSDVGNISIGSGGTQPSPTTNYYEGRFSNGPVWVEYLAKDLGVAAPTAALAGGTDYAFGGAQTGTGYTASTAPRFLTSAHRSGCTSARERSDGQPARHDLGRCE